MGVTPTQINDDNSSDRRSIDDQNNSPRRSITPSTPGERLSIKVGILYAQYCLCDIQHNAILSIMMQY